MVEPGINQILNDKDEGARCEIARRLGERLTEADISDVDRRAAETLARLLAEDAIERVRLVLSETLRHAPLLPKDIARKIAHDVDAVAVPFLEITDVFSDSDWAQLVLTLSRGALVAVSGRAPMPEFLALRLAELGDSVVAETLIENPATPMTEPVCHTIMDRFEAEMWVLDKLADRGDLMAEIAATLTLKVSRSAREKLKRTYELGEASERLLPDVETASLVRLAMDTDPSNLLALARRLKDEHSLTPDVALATLRGGSLEFCAAAISVLGESRFEHVRSAMRRADAATVIRLLARAGVSEATRDEFWSEIETARANKKHD